MPPMAYEPFGQGPLPKWGAAAHKAHTQAIQKCKRDLTNWPEMVPSFELWAAATKYDDRAEDKDGGPEFHTLMRYMLVDGGGGHRRRRRR